MACVGGGNGCGRRGLAINHQANEDRLCACQSTIEIEQLHVAFAFEPLLCLFVEVAILPVGLNF